MNLFFYENTAYWEDAFEKARDQYLRLNDFEDIAGWLTPERGGPILKAIFERKFEEAYDLVYKLRLIAAEDHADIVATSQESEGWPCGK